MSAVIEKQTAVAVPATAPSLVSRFAARYNVEPAKLLSTLKATAFYSADAEVTNEQMMSLLIVADQYHLNPFTREIYAFPDKKKGGIVPIVGVDGWARIVNEQPEYDGVEFIDGPASEKHKGAPEWIECIMHRKDRQHATRIRERLIECFRDTGPWGSHPARFLRHKAFMQCARLAFAFVGIYDEDEAQRIIEGGTGNVGEEATEIASINKTISRGKSTIEGEAQRVDTVAPAANGQPKTSSAPTAASSDSPAEPVGGAVAGAESTLTVVDYIAFLAKHNDSELMALWADAEVPMEIRQEEKFMRAYKARRDAIRREEKK